MSYTAIKNLTTVNYSKGNNRSIRHIVLHYTGNATDTAKNNANYFKSVNRGASAHYFVDETTVYQVVEDADIAWSVGKNFGKNNLFHTVKNANSLNVEMCSSGGRIADATFHNAAALVKSLMAKYGIPASNVYRHYDVCSKQCPGWTGWGTTKNDAGALWTSFKNALTDNNPTNAATLSDAQQALMEALGIVAGNSTLQDAQNILQEALGIKNQNTENEAAQINKTEAASTSSPSVKNAIVADGQQHANNFAGCGLSIDGIRGDKSKKGGTKCLQNALNLDYNAGLKVDGVWGAQTKKALGNHYVKIGETQYLVTAVEILLMLKGYNTNGVESPGVFGNGLYHCVMRYQKEAGLKQDGIAGRNTIISLIA